MNSPAVNPAPPGRALIETPITLRWRDLDAFEHVNNSTFLTFIEEARLRWFAAIDGPWLTPTYAPVVAATHVNYRSQMTWPGRIVVALYCERVGNASLTIAHRIVDAEDRYATVFGWHLGAGVDRAGQRKIRGTARGGAQSVHLAQRRPGFTAPNHSPQIPRLPHRLNL